MLMIFYVYCLVIFEGLGFSIDNEKHNWESRAF